MAEARKRRKRRPINGCPNPLFVQWVEEWRDEARNDGLKTQYTYTKVYHVALCNYMHMYTSLCKITCAKAGLRVQALNSLRKYPLPLSSGQEAKILNHIGM